METTRAAHVRQELGELIAAAVPEGDPERRLALLVLADHWGEMLRQAQPLIRREPRAEVFTTMAYTDNGPLRPEAIDGDVVSVNPPAEPMHMTEQEADISAVRLLDAADRARKQNNRTEDLK
jgi:hypothetical protein